MVGYLDVADTYLYNAKNESDSSYEIGKQEYEKENGTSICFDRYEWDTYLYDKVKELLESKAVVKQ